MIAGIGVDLTTVSRIAKTHDRFGERFAKRILNQHEMPGYLQHSVPERYLAKRFAVKEAAVKALGTGEQEGVLLKDFYLEHNALGKPLLRVSGEAEVRCINSGINSFWVSLSDEIDTVIALVVLERLTQDE